MLRAQRTACRVGGKAERDMHAAVIDTLTPPGRRGRPPSPSRGGKEKGHRPVFTRVHRRLMTRWIAGVRAVMTNSFCIVASSG